MSPSTSSSPSEPTFKVGSGAGSQHRDSAGAALCQGDAEVAAALADLSESATRVVELLSIMHGPVAHNELSRGVRSLKVRNDKGKLLTSQSLRKSLSQLASAGLITRKPEPVCRPELVDAITRSAQRAGTFEAAATAVYNLRPSPRLCRRYADAAALVRIQLFRGDTEALWQTWNAVKAAFPDEEQSLVGLIFAPAFDAVWFKTFPDEVREVLLPELADHVMAHLAPMPQLVPLLEESAADIEDPESSRICIKLAELRLLGGQMDALRRQIVGWYSPGSDMLRGALRTLRGEFETAIELYEAALAQLNRRRRKNRIYFSNHVGVFFIAALLKTGDAQRYRQAFQYIKTAVGDRQHDLHAVYRFLHRIVRPLVEDVDEEQIPVPTKVFLYGQEFSLATQRWAYMPVLWLALGRSWHGLDDRKNRDLRQELEAVEARARAAGLHWVATTADELKVACGAKRRKATGKADSTVDSTGGAGASRELCSLLGPIARRPAWRRTLDALTLAVEPDSAAATGDESRNARKSRLVWRVEFEHGEPFVRPLEQRCNAQGKWSKGRTVALKRLHDGWKSLDWLSSQDRTVCSHIECKVVYEGYGRYSKEVYVLDGVEACRALRGHPLVFLAAAPTQRLEIVDGEPEVRVSAESEGFQVEILPAGSDGVAAVRDGPNRLKIVEFSPIQQRLRTSLGKRSKTAVPRAGKDELAAVLSAIAPHIRIQSDLVAATGDDAQAVPANARPTVRLKPNAGGLQIELVVHPFATDSAIRGPSYRCGTGGVNVVATIAPDSAAAVTGGRAIGDSDGRETMRLSTVRDLDAEIAALEALWAEIPTISTLCTAQHAARGDTWIVPMDTGLALVRALHKAGEMAFVEWPDGDPWQVRDELSLEAAKLRIRTRRDDFVVTGDVQLGDGDALAVSSLVGLLADSPGDFVKLGDGSFISLSETFRERLDDLRAFADATDKGLVMPKLAAATLGDIVDGVGRMRADKGWREHVARLASTPKDAEVPSTLAVELRDYQIDGFRWLGKLASWGLGACLADDMGLGKTIQALAFLVSRAPAGPALVVAPTSVVTNWLDEATRFAPTLRASVYHGKERGSLLDDLGPFDVILCSYAILQRDSEQLGESSWHTLIFDEAQAIKNRATKRWKAAKGLSADCRIMMTGTPVENRVAELWNLFAILAPGLLGSAERFAERYANPIEKRADRGAHRRLNHLIRPFVLRRTKAQVLHQLPPRTDIVLYVDLTTEEVALYEAIRQQALERLVDGEKTENARRMQIFAELMRLRRACCSPALVFPEQPARSAKMTVFNQLVGDLLSNGHRALVFSQFVDHLQLLRAELDAAGHTYHYLDGSTPMKKRKQRIDAFQAGDGDLFLISLKAGGVGLNLTGADYVVHMDPWWNPAVEDQASDRAHRIGQKRPVTVYRLVARGTIEERIVRLHHQKRALADGLLQGTGESATLSPQMLLQLIREPAGR